MDSISSSNDTASRQSSIDMDIGHVGMTISALADTHKKKIQLQILEGMFKYAEKKYGRKRPHGAAEDKRSPMEDYELYLRSLNIKVKSSNDKLAVIMKQKRDIESKLAEAEKEHNFHKSKYTKAEEEKNNSINEGRDPVLPKDFIPPQKVKSRGKAANLGALVMKASSQMDIWHEKFNAKRSKKNADTPEWIAKQKKSDKTSALLNIGRNKMKDKKSESHNKFAATTLHKTERTKSKKDEDNLVTTKDEHTPVPREQHVKEASPETSEEETETEEPTIQRRRSRIPRSDDEDFDL